MGWVGKWWTDKETHGGWFITRTGQNISVRISAFHLIRLLTTTIHPYYRCWNSPLLPPHTTTRHGSAESISPSCSGVPQLPAVSEGSTNFSSGNDANVFNDILTNNWVRPFHALAWLSQSWLYLGLHGTHGLNLPSQARMVWTCPIRHEFSNKGDDDCLS